MGISTDLFKEPQQIQQDFICSICHDVLEEATMLEPCEHTYCKKCIDQYHEVNDGEGPKTCPMDRQAVTGFRKPPRIYLNLLENLELRCLFHSDGCATALRVGEFFGHLHKCEFKPCAGGCGALLKDIKDQNHNCTTYMKGRMGAMQQELDRTKKELQMANRLLRPRVFFDINADGQPLGRITLELRADVVPKTAENFRAAAVKGGYKGTWFYRIIPGTLCEAYVKNYFSMKTFTKENFELSRSHTGPGTLAMSDSLFSSKKNGPNFFITCAWKLSLDGKFVVFGSVVDGMDVVKKMEEYGTKSKSGKTSKNVMISDCGQL